MPFHLFLGATWVRQASNHPGPQQLLTTHSKSSTHHQQSISSHSKIMKRHQNSNTTRHQKSSTHHQLPMSIPLHQDTSRYISCNIRCTFRRFAPQRFAQLRCSEWAPHYRACSRGHRGDDGFLWSIAAMAMGQPGSTWEIWRGWCMDDLYEPFRYQDPLRSMILWNSPTCGHGSWENSSGKTDEIIHWYWAEQQLHFRCDLTTQIQKRSLFFPSILTVTVPHII